MFDFIAAAAAAPANGWEISGTIAGWTAVGLVILGALLSAIFAVGGLFKDVSNLKDTTRDLVIKFDNLFQNSIDNMKIIVPGSTESALLFRHHSPRQLTEAGKTLAEDSGIAAIVNNNLDYILKFVGKHGHRNAYEVEQNIMSALEGLTDDKKHHDISNTIEKSAYNSGTTPLVLLTVGTIYIRDKVLEHFEFTPEEISGEAKPKVPKVVKAAPKKKTAAKKSRS